MQKNIRELLGVLVIFSIVIVVGITQLYTFVKIHQNVHL